MSLQALRRLSREAAEAAAQKGLTPLVIYEGDVGAWRRANQQPIPNLGDHIPEGWERMPSDGWWFVDKTEKGHAGEPALTIDQFFLELTEYAAEHPDHGYGIAEEGLCQLHVAQYRPVQSKE